jgi:predicted PurR-regulated permease PerM
MADTRSTNSPAASSESVLPSPQPQFALILALQIGVAVVAGLYLARDVLIPITAAVLLSFVLTPLVNLLRHAKLGRVPAVLLAVVVALAAILVVGGFVGTQVTQLATRIPEYASTIESKVDAVRSATVDRVSDLLRRVDRAATPPDKDGLRATTPPHSGVQGPAQAPSPPAVAPATGLSPLALAERYLWPILSPIATLGIIVVVAIFVLLQKEDLRDRLIRLFGATDLHRTTAAMDDAANRNTGLSPFSVIVSAIFWSWLWGPIGLLLSMPLTLSLVVLGRHVEKLQFLDVMLGDRPALSPAESFYQRVLTGDADEAEDHAELLLKQHSLSSYYDEVALKGLQLAAYDTERGLLRPNQLDAVRNTVRLLVNELAGHKDEQPSADEAEKEPAGTPADERDIPKIPLPLSAPNHAKLAPAWKTDTPVLCLAGKGPLDEAASVMLAQLLEKHGIGARVASYDAASREAIGGLDVQGTAMVCISYLHISGTPSHLRYLMRRVRRKLPSAAILVGLWQADDMVLTDERIKAAVGADYYTTSLREAVNACVEAASGVKASASAA